MAASAPRFNDARFGDAIAAVRRFIYLGEKVSLPTGWTWFEGSAVGYHYRIGIVPTPTGESYQFAVRRDSYKMTEKHRQMVMAVCGNAAFVTSDYEMRHDDPQPISTVYALAYTALRCRRRVCSQIAHGNPAVAAAFEQRRQAEAAAAAPAAVEAAAADAAAAAVVNAAIRADYLARTAAAAAEDEDLWARHAAERRAAAAAALLAVEAPQELVLEECVADCDDPQECEPESITA